ncbi:hypothetical protein GWK48_03355 [Metallosphaera tengchongensis]|uniref:Uncharacterized protein n=1 Tax=Metallosphaera tengchongensis TaxID=1532350 RepID=A0A6N0P131_9CREN|nr:hypothetical protein GWK48_03355 [Metallosphaera tengchongensis]
MKFLGKVFMPYAMRTINDGVEFISFTLDTGEYVIFQGEENRVSLPMPSGVTSAHTHPGVCLFSGQDLETADFLFIKGYVSVGVMNPECALLIYRDGPYTLEDRDALLNLTKRVKSSKKLNDLVNAYLSFKTENLKLMQHKF